MGVSSFRRTRPRKPDTKKPQTPQRRKAGITPGLRCVLRAVPPGLLRHAGGAEALELRHLGFVELALHIGQQVTERHERMGELLCGDLPVAFFLAGQLAVIQPAAELFFQTVAGLQQTVLLLAIKTGHSPRGVRKPGDMFSPALRTGLTAFQSMEDCAGALDYSLRALESSARTILALGR